MKDMFFQFEFQNLIIFSLKRMLSSKVLFIVIGVFLVTVITTPPVLVASSSKQKSFHLQLSLQPNSLYHIYSQIIGNNKFNLIDIDTNTDPATFNSSIKDKLILVNAVHQGRHWVQYYQPAAVGQQNNDHFHFAEVFYEGGFQSYLLPTFPEKTRGLLLDHLYRCSNTLISVDWHDNNAEIVAVSEDTNWRIHENIDNGHRGKDKDVSYIYAIDEGHVHPIRIDIGDKFFCQISTQTKPLILNYDFRTKSTYQLKELLFLAKESIPIQTKKDTLDLDL